MSAPQGRPIVGYVATSPESVKEILRMAEVKATDVVYDLGCGDGRIAIAAVRDFGAKKGVGVEIQKELVNKAREAVSESGLAGKVEIIHADMLGADISDADVVALYLSTTANEEIRPKLERELKEGARAVSRSFTFKGWTPDRAQPIRGGRLYLYRIRKKPSSKA